MMNEASARQSGFSLIEMVVVIMIIAVVAGMIGLFIKAPLQGYVDSARRAESNRCSRHGCAPPDT